MASVSNQSLLIFTNQFAAMVNSHLPLANVLDNLSSETPEKQFREIIEDVSEDVKSGMDLGDALYEYPDVFDMIYVNIVNAGIRSGRLGDALDHLSTHLTNADTITRKLKAAFSYPLFVLAAFFVAFNGMAFFILPRFEAMFSSFCKELPYATQVMMSMAEFWRDYWHVILGGITMVVLGIIVWLSTEDGRYIWDEQKLKVPVLGRMWRMASLSRFIRTFAVQVSNDVDVLESLRLAAPASGNVFLREMIYLIADDIERGRGIAQAFHDHEVFGGIVLQMVASGEEAGTLDKLLLSAADYYDRLLENQLQTWTGLINPILTVVVGLGIGAMMIAVFLPVFEMGSASGRSC